MRHLVILFIMSSANSLSFLEVVLTEWNTWKISNMKGYASDTEENFRMKIYMENKAKIERHNAQAHAGLHSYFLKMNHFGDLLHHEFRRTMNGYNMRLKNQSQKDLGATFIGSAHLQSLPKNVDWRKLGAVTAVKDQGQCGSCWSFATTGALEAMNFRKTGRLLSLSEQNLVDCSRKYGNMGCNGGLMDNAFRYIKENGGIDTESSYPYEGEEDVCRYNPKWKGASDIGFVDIESGNELKLKEAVATQGPCAIAIDAGHESFQFYSHGIYHDNHCSPDRLDHGVLLVGYGEENGNKYWLIKNSWSAKWGDNGYIKIARENGNMCGVASQASYPLV